MPPKTNSVTTNKNSTSPKQPQVSYMLKGECCYSLGSLIKGTLYFGGAGLEGEYIVDMVKALRRAGIRTAQYVDREKWSAGTLPDAVIGVLAMRDVQPYFPLLLRIFKTDSDQFNLIGYSYGSLVAAQIAFHYANTGTQIDHLVLIGSPISANLLKILRYHPRIKKVIVKDLTQYGDPIYAGISRIELTLSVPKLRNQMAQGSGHFHYAPSTPEGERRRFELALELYRLGLR
ncbi:hypothetical protein THII_2626 [Thioploca ingrica]|uniref:Uncharacterized protein n=1 Tax=Thioploca ingrica TaxID=40754 RepID=A0A090AFL8_9GAMM|nr:hypothetical protein THII_2626 [Thioploca ingrica]